MREAGGGRRTGRAPNPILALAMAGDYAGAWRAHARLAQPGPEDDRWVGHSLAQLGRLSFAGELLRRAVAGGCRAAAIELASVQRLQGDPAGAAALLEDIDAASLEPVDRARRDVELGYVCFSEGRLIEATEVLERAWLAQEGIPGGETLRANVSCALGLVLNARGLDARAETYLAAGLRAAPPALRAQLHFSRALGNSYLGNFREAARDLALAAPLTQAVPLMVPIVAYGLGVLERSRGRYRLAATHYERAARLSRAIDEVETNQHSLLGLAAACTARDDLGEAQRALDEALPMLRRRRPIALHALRQGALLTRRDHPDALRHLDFAASEFAALGLEREKAWAYLHVAEAHLRAGRAADADECLRGALAAREVLGGGNPLLLELRALPRALARLEELPGGRGAVLARELSTLRGAVPLRLDLRTLGGQALEAAGRPLPLHQPGSIELLAYLVTRPNRPVEQVRAALDPDSDLPEFRRRFHAMRADLERAAPGLRIAHETSSRTYRVDLDGPELDWDAHRLFALLRPGPTRDPAAALDAYHGPFLPDATSEWSRAARVTLDSQVLAAGLEAAGERYSSGQHEGALQLAERLLEHWPLDERAARLYLRATARARGTAAAAQAAARLRAGGLDSAVVDALERELLQPN